MAEEYGYTKDYLTKDGEPWFPVMGEFHFSRYPEKYWKLANYYYVHKKTLVSRKNTEKLQNLVRQKENWEYFIRKCFGSYPF